MCAKSRSIGCSTLIETSVNWVTKPKRSNTELPKKDVPKSVYALRVSQNFQNVCIILLSDSFEMKTMLLLFTGKLTNAKDKYFLQSNIYMEENVCWMSYINRTISEYE